VHGERTVESRRPAPDIRAMILDRQPGALPEGMNLYLTLYCGPSSRIVGPSLLIDRQTRQWRWVLEVAYPPLATLLVLVGDAEPPPYSTFPSSPPGPPAVISTIRRSLTLALGIHHCLATTVVPER